MLTCSLSTVEICHIADELLGQFHRDHILLLATCCQAANRGSSLQSTEHAENIVIKYVVPTREE